VTFFLAIAATLAARVAVLVLALASSVILARMLGPEGRGVFASVLLLPELARSLGLLGFEQANAVYAGLAPRAGRALVWHSVVIAAAMGVLLAGGIGGYLVLGGPGAGGLVRGPLWLYLLPLAATPVRLLTEYWGAIVRGVNRIGLLNSVEVGGKIVSLALVAVLVVGLRLEVAGAVSADLVLTAVSAIVLAGLLRHVGVWGAPCADRALWTRTRRFALPAHCTTVMTFLNYRLDQFLVAALLSPQDLAFYVIAVDLAERIWILTGAVATPLLPHLTNAPDRRPDTAAVVTRHVMLWTAGGCLAVLLAAGVVVPLVYSSAFAPVVTPLRYLLPGVLALTAGKLLVAELLAREKVRPLVWMAAVGLVVNVLGNLALIPSMGISGAAIASSVSYSLVSLLVTVYYLRETRVSWLALVPSRADLLVYGMVWRRWAGGPVAVKR